MQSRQASKPRLIQAMADAFSLPDLRRRLLFTLGILVLFRFLAQVPVPSIGPDALEAIKRLFDPSEGNALFSMLNLLSGGAMSTFSIVAMGVYPYITATIIMQLLVPIVPRLRAIASEGEGGRERINLYTHWLMVPLAALQAWGQLTLMRDLLIRNFQIDVPTTPLSLAAIIITLTAGTMLLVWLGELITERGIGNGISLLIFAGIVVSVPGAMWQSFDVALDPVSGIANLLKLTAYSVAIIVLIVYVTEAYRQIPVHYSRSLFRGRRMYRQSGATHIPLRVNMAGMIPLIFALSIMTLPATIAGFFPDNSMAITIRGWFDPTNWFYWFGYFVLVVGFTFFYTLVVFEQQNLAETLQKQGGFVPGIRPGRHTSRYLNQVIYRITWGGAFFLGVVAVAPYFSQWIAGVQPGFMIISSAGALIAVGVALDTMRQLETQLLMRRYEGFLR